MTVSERYVVISADGHCGADLRDYKPYLEQRYHEEFDAWASAFDEPWAGIDDDDDEFRIGTASYGSDVNWDSAKRNEHIEREGIAGEVLFPNTAPPFFPSGNISAHGPKDQSEYELRFAGIQAHNRWLADFCSQLRGRRAGIAQLFLNDIDRAVAEVTWAKEHGLMGVLLPPDHVLGLSNLYYLRLDPLWAACQDLDLPIHRHAIAPTEAPAADNGYASVMVGVSELPFYTMRPLTHLIISGVFDRFPFLKLVFTENQVLPTWMASTQLDMYYDYIQGTWINDVFGNQTIENLKRRPSEYARENVYYGSFLSAADIAARHEPGVDHIMWGADYPHHEGTAPYSKQALRINFAWVPHDEVKAMLSDTAIAVYGFDEAAVREAADRIGPTAEDLAVPNAIDEVPPHARIWCPTFNVVLGGAAMDGELVS